ncbi:MAG: hypothetical protein LBI80_00335 [Endomicrobium sp.]|jgi:hypothetical protein|nr:hypothetical protein [Endomicrobium sp.]
MKDYKGNIRPYNQQLDLGEKILAFVIAFLAILSCSPVIFYGFNSTLILLFIGGYFLFFVKQVFKERVSLRKNDLNIFLISFTLFLYIAIPFREYDRFSPSVIWLFIFSMTLFLNKILLNKAFYYFSNLILIVCIFSLFVLVLNALGVSLPNIVIPRESGGHFTSYFISVRLSWQDYSLWGLNLYRLNGIFAEPGHFGLLLCMILFVYKAIIKTIKGKIILLTSLLTLSFGSFVLLFGFFIINIILEKKIYLAFIIVPIVVLALLYVPQEVLERFFFDKQTDLLDERTSVYFIDFYNQHYNQGDIVFGNGRDILYNNDLQNSDYRGFVIRYGYTGIFLYLILMFSIYWKKAFTVQFLGFFYFIVVFLHRSWFVDYFAFLFFLLVLATNFNSETKVVGLK